jgi:hypothetical protein
MAAKINLVGWHAGQDSSCKYPEYLLNVVVENMTPLLRIQEMPGSVLGCETGYPDGGLRRLLQSFKTNAGKIAQSRARPLPYTSISIY